MPENKDIHQDLLDRFGLDPTFRTPLPVNAYFAPAIEEQILHEDKESLVKLTNLGTTVKLSKTQTAVPLVLDYPVKTRQDWEKIKAERLDPDYPGRIPENIKQLARMEIEKGQLVNIGGRTCGVFGSPRELVGDEKLLMLLFDEPGLVHEMMETFTQLWLTLFEKVCKLVKVDRFLLWEDIAYRNGPLISPAHFEQFLCPRYRQIKQFCKKHEIKLLTVDSDGDISKLVPLWVASGINELYPFEVQSGCDVNQYRREFSSLAMFGGFDKRALARGKTAIDAELNRVCGLAWKGGYVVSTDHSVPPDVQYADWLYFIEQLGIKMGAIN